MMRILFLDVDGVLNHRGVFVAGNGAMPLCQAALGELARVINDADCRVVLSSTWRLLGRAVERLPILLRYQFHEDWRTIEIRHGKSPGGVWLPTKRGEEIDEWLGRHPEVERYAIVDDDSDFLDHQLQFFVKTDFDAGGLTAECADRLIAILSPPRADGGADITMTHTNIAGA
jgi:hypothetical protein